MRWDVFCRVIDNFGDIGVCWRLSAGLAARGETVRLWVDDQLIINEWISPKEATGSIALVAGQSYPIKMEYYDSLRNAQVVLRWSSGTQPIEVVPAESLSAN